MTSACRSTGFGWPTRAATTMRAITDWGGDLLVSLCRVRLFHGASALEAGQERGEVGESCLHAGSGWRLEHAIPHGLVVVTQEHRERRAAALLLERDGLHTV